VYFNGNASGSFSLTDTVTDAGSNPVSAMFPAISTTGWTHGAETITSGSGSAPSISYTSSAFSWTAGASTPSGYSVSSSDALGNAGSTPVTFVDDTTPPSGGALSVNSTAASAGGSSSAAASTSFTINSRTDYTDSGSGIASSTLTVQSESLTGSTCGTPGSGGPFTSPVTITGTTQPSGIVAGYCYLYTLTGTDNVGNTTSITTTVTVANTSAPGVPTAVAASPGDNQAVVSFDPPASNGGSPITHYTVTANPGGLMASGTTSPITVPTLSNGVAYTFNVTATNGVGTGEPSAPATATPGTVPCRPVIGNVSTSPYAATVDVVATCDGGYPILSYTVTASPGDITYASATEPITVPNLSPNTYTFTVTATNSFGASGPSAPSSFIEVPGGPVVIVQANNQAGTNIDAATGDLIQPDGSEIDPLTCQTVVPAPSVPPTLATFSGYLLTEDPVSGLYTSFFGTTVDTAGNEYDPYGDLLDTIDPFQAYYVTTDGTVVSVNNPSVQLDPVTLAPVSDAVYTIDSTPIDYSVAFGGPSDVELSGGC
jgi:hypothetical protein